MKFSSQSTLVLLNLWVILMGGHVKCLRLMTGGGEGGQKSQKHAYVIHGCSLIKAKTGLDDKQINQGHCQQRTPPKTKRPCGTSHPLRGQIGDPPHSAFRLDTPHDSE